MEILPVLQWTMGRMDKYNFIHMQVHKYFTMEFLIVLQWIMTLQIGKGIMIANLDMSEERERQRDREREKREEYWLNATV